MLVGNLELKTGKMEDLVTSKRTCWFLVAGQYLIAQTSASKCWVTQKGRDGFGHQLRGMLTVAALHNSSKYAFDASDRRFTFEHIDGVKASRASMYLRDALADLRQGIPATPPLVHKFVHEVWLIPNPCDPAVIYELDNAFYHERGQCTTSYNLPKRVKDAFRTHLPKRQTHNGTVAHIRLGDSGSRGRAGLQRRIDWLLARKGPVIIHTDDKSFVESQANFGPNVHIFGRDTDILDALSDMANARAFLAADSSISMAAAFLRTGLTYMMQHVDCHKSSRQLKLPPHVLLT